MIRKNHNSGYTIVEVMIVLAISAAVFAGAITGFISQNKRTAFNQGVKDLELKLQDVLNDVGTGYYPNSGNFTCSRQGPATNAQVQISNSPSEQGSNEGCIFLGKVIDPLGNVSDSNIEIYTLVGLKNSKNNADIISESLEDAGAGWFKDIQGAYENYVINGSIQIKKILIGDGTSSDLSEGFGIISGFGSGEGGGSGATTNQVTAAPLQSNADGSWSAILNSPITICVEEAGGGQNARHATIKIGTSSKVNVETSIDDWPEGCS